MAPKFIRSVFDRFPLWNYPSEVLPASPDYCTSSNLLHVFGNPGSNEDSLLSFNPTCLKWQTYFRICDIEHKIVVSNNHASPTGSLPFLIPLHKLGTSSREVIPVTKLGIWVDQTTKQKRVEIIDFSLDIQMLDVLLNTKIRDAWLYSLYLEPRNFSTITLPRYNSSTLAWPVAALLGHQMLKSAVTEIKKSRPNGIIDSDEIYADAGAAFAAIAEMLGNRKWFSGTEDPGLFDASVFAYTHLLLTGRFHSDESNLLNTLSNHENLIKHRNRIQNGWYS